MVQWADRGFLFSGYGWKVKGSDEWVSPGPNLFSDSDDNVWLDTEGHLHLRITPVNGAWECAQVMGTDSFGYGRYEVHLAPGAEALDPNVLFALYTWARNPDQHHRRILLQLSRRGEPEGRNARYGVEPTDTPGNVHSFRFDGRERETTHRFDWREGRIEFGSERGDPEAVIEPTEVVETWTYAGRDVPTPGAERPCLGLWLLGGQPPRDGREAEVVVSRFELTPPG